LSMLCRMLRSRSSACTVDSSFSAMLRPYRAGG
jgi:hypothetical protein